MNTPLRKFRAMYQFGFSILIVTALVIQYVYGVIDEKAFTLQAFVDYTGLYISYFTILSNILVAYVLCAEARKGFRGEEVSGRFDFIRSTAVFCIATTGIIYSFFLKGPGGQGAVTDSIGWINAIFHYIMPSVMVIDWILFPTRKPVRWISIIFWIAITVVYLAFVEVLGLFTKTYPYFFLNPIMFHGYSGVLRASVAFIPFFLVFGAVVVGINRIRLLFK